MDHRVLTRLIWRPSFGLHPIWGVSALLTLVGVTFWAATSWAAEDAGLAFVLGPGSQLVVGKEDVPLPEGARLELLVSGKKVDGRYPLQARPGGLVLPEFALGSDGERLRVRLGDSSGWLSPGPDGLAADLVVTVEVELSDEKSAQSGAYALALTTGQVEAAAGAAGSDALVASGAAIDAASRAARFVAAGTVAADSPVAPGEPLLVVLEGTFEGLPSDLR